MGSFIVRVDQEGREPRYLEWGTITDTPTTVGMARAEFEEYYRERYGTEGLRRLPDRLKRADGPRRSSSQVPDCYDRADLMLSFRWEWFEGLRDRDDGITPEELWHWYCDLREEPSADSRKQEGS